MQFYVIQTKVFSPPKRNAKGEWTQELVPGPVAMQASAGEPNFGSNVSVLWRGESQAECERQFAHHRRRLGQA